MKDVQAAIQASVSALYATEIRVELTRPDVQFGDYSTNVALQLAKKLNVNPREIAEHISERLLKDAGLLVQRAEIAGPGFINVWIHDKVIIDQLPHTIEIPSSLSNKQVVVEYSDPNPFKVLHAGHLYTSVVGDAIANLLQAAGATVYRVNFGGDVGLHVGKTMWAVLHKLGSEKVEALQAIPEADFVDWMSDAYVEGTAAYEDDEQAKQVIIDLNKRIYTIHKENDQTSDLAKIYWHCRSWFYDVYFKSFYDTIGTHFDKYYPESVVAELGAQTVRKHIGPGVFEESDGAIVFKGEPYGLHTRVFINQQGLPTYEAKDVGLIFTKKQDFDFDLSVVITGNEQEQYMAVVLKAIEQFVPELTQATKHLTHGMVKLQGGQKMSSRKGNVLRAVDVLEAASQANKNATGKTDKNVELGAVKYAFLKVRTGGDIIYSPEESVSLEGNSGPYLQYAHARARSILAKAKEQDRSGLDSLKPGERLLAVKLLEYPDVVTRAIEELMPHLVCTYLYEAAQVFNRFYEQNRVIDDPREAERLQLVASYADVLKAGLSLLGIHAPDSM
ncbi:MAG TPA: arginine--tRNA ligase [Candidatus Saccharibacteria bacterium]|nr:arginine--tRNA ligase [Candidatus Saccharibacteria bacterium]